MGAFRFRLEQVDGSPADPPTFETAVPNWQPGDEIPLGGTGALRVIGVKAGMEPDGDRVLIVEPQPSEAATT